MGAWGTGILENDTSAEIYDEFMDLYNSGEDPTAIAEHMITENRERIENTDDCNNFWFGIALAQWETKSDSAEVIAKVTAIIESENDLTVWRELDADESDIEKRKKVLHKFLEKLQSERKRPKARQKVKTVIAAPIFSKGTCLTFKLNNGNYGGALVLEGNENPKFGGNTYIATTRINQSTKPTTKDIENGELLLTNFFPTSDSKGELIWYDSNSFSEYEGLFEVVGQVKVHRKYAFGGIGTRTTAGWDYIKIDVERQLEFEKTNPAPETAIKIKDLIQNNKWWKLV